MRLEVGNLPGESWRRRADSNRRMRVLQTLGVDPQAPVGTRVCDADGSDLPANLPETDGLQETSADLEGPPPDLTRLTSIWPNLPEHIRAAILTLAEGARPLDEEG